MRWWNISIETAKYLSHRNLRVIHVLCALRAFALAKSFSAHVHVLILTFHRPLRVTEFNRIIKKKKNLQYQKLPIENKVSAKTRLDT